MTEITHFPHMFGGFHEAEAYRWINPDGSEGGIVARSAVLPAQLRLPIDCVVWPDAKINDGASIGNGASIGKGASIGYRASIGKGASIGDRASIGEGASIGYGASIGDRAQVESDDWLFVAGPQGSRNALATVIYSENHGLRWWIGCQTGITTEALIKRIARDHGDNDHAADYRYLIQTVENHPGLARKKAEIAARTATAPAQPVGGNGDG